MAINYQSSFNSGELGRKVDGRSDLDVYRNGCRLLQNFFVLPQGGVERRTGTEFVGQTNDGEGTEGDLSVRLIPFIFSSEEAYALEFGNQYILAHYTDASGVDQVVAATGLVPYTAADVSKITFDQRFDVMFLTHPDFPVQTLSRTSIDPAFEIEALSFDYPPFLEENSDVAKTVALRYEDWDSTEDYLKDSYIFYGGAHYRCILDSTTVLDPVIPNSPTEASSIYWSIVPEDEVPILAGETVVISSTDNIFTESDG